MDSKKRDDQSKKRQHGGKRSEAEMILARHNIMVRGYNLLAIRMLARYLQGSHRFVDEGWQHVRKNHHS